MLTRKKMDIVLTVEQLKWVTQEVAPPIPNEFSTQEEKDAHYQWQRVDEKACCIILRSLSNVLQ